MTSRFSREYDRESVEKGVSLYFHYRKEAIEFQFMPEITADSRRISWDTSSTVSGRDPYAQFTNNSARDISMKIEYIIEESEPDQMPSNSQAQSPQWNVSKIKYNLNIIKGYFSARAGFGEVPTPQLAVSLSHSLITGFGMRTVRLNGFNVEYSGPPIGVLPMLAHPLKTTITIDLSTMSSVELDKNLSLMGTFDSFPRFNDWWF
jgi:hypothetical protein